MRWPWSKRPAPPEQWFVHYQESTLPEYVSPPMSEQDAVDELGDLRAFQHRYPPETREFITNHGPVTITSFSGCRAWIDTQ